MKLTQISRRIESLESKVCEKQSRPIVYMVADRPVPLGAGEPEPPVPPGHLRLYFASFGEGNERYKDVPREEVRQWLEGNTGLVVWITAEGQD